MEDRKRGGIMGKRTIIPFGPQHPALPEPIHLDLELEDETVIRAIPSIGYVHRGLEKLAEINDYNKMTYVMERVCGICSFGHGWGYTAAVEGLMNIEIPERASYLRTIFLELSRTHSHLLWLGLLADGMGFESLFMQSWRLRERVLDLFEKTTGGRVIMSFCKVGGLWRDITPEMLTEIGNTVKILRKEVKQIADVFLNDASVKNRMVGVGMLSAQEARDLCAVGPVARGSGIDNDTRTNGWGAYSDLDFEPIIETAGDCYSRCKVRVRELSQSFDLIDAAIGMIPGGDIAVTVKGNPPVGEFAMRIEQPRGDAFYYVKGNGTKNLDRVRVRTPTNTNIPSLVKILQGAQLNDVTMLILTLDPCISCTER
jgi:ech hydrogenase subunit E